MTHSMDILAGGCGHKLNVKERGEQNNTSHAAHDSKFLNSMKNVFHNSAVSPVDHGVAPKEAFIKNIKDRRSTDKNRGVEDALQDIEALIRRIEKKNACKKHK